MTAFGGWHLTRTGILFVIGIIVLGGLVTGGVFLIKNHGEMVRRDQAAKIAQQNLESQSKTTPTTKVVTNSSSTTTGSGATNTAIADSNPSTTTSTTTQSTSQLPVTGINPFSTFETAGILAILAFSVTSFVASRRAAGRL